MKDETDRSFLVTLFPSETCTCDDYKNCCHLLSVQNFNGKPLENAYKLPTLTQLTQRKNKGLTGRKQKNHEKNTKDPNVPDKLSIEQDVVKIVLALVQENQHSGAEIIIKGKRKIRDGFLIENFIDLSDVFLDDNLDFKAIEKYFTKKAWTIAFEMLKMKRKHSKCPVCDKFCFSECILCEDCNFWYHWSCASVTDYYQKRKNAKWVCSKFGKTCVHYLGK